MPELKTYTQEGYNALLKELEHMKAEREKNKKEISEARSYGDLSENSEYDEAKSNQAKIAIRIAELEEMVKTAVVQKSDEIDHTKVNVGSTVEIYNKTKAKACVYRIVGSYEANALEGLISDESPIGKELLGHSAGDSVTVKLPNGMEQIIEIKSVSRS